MLMSLIIELGGLTVGLLIIGFVLTRLAQARTLFLVKFTEDVFWQAANSPTKFDQASDLIGPQNGENSVRPLKGKYAQSTPKMQVLNKVAAMCKASKQGVQSDELTKDDAEVMWNEFLRFR